jgi:hypothetical protein
LFLAIHAERATYHLGCLEYRANGCGLRRLATFELGLTLGSK